MRVAIMQPTFLPWVGYFDLLDQVDTFIFLDSVQFERQSWQQRNRIRTANGWQWVTVPVRHRFPQTIHEVEINSTTDWQQKHWRAFQQHYAVTPFWDRYQDFLRDLYARSWKSLAELNIFAITYIADELGITPVIARSSKMAASGQRVNLLISLCREVKADTYLSPAGAAPYIEQDNRFIQTGIMLEYHRFTPVPYRQRYAPFIPYLSVIDLLFNEGPRCLEIIRAGRGLQIGH